MNRNLNSRFDLAPTVGIGRSKFPIHNAHYTSFNVGQLVPFYCAEVMPGDTFDVVTNLVCRLQTPITPFMDVLRLDYYYFFVPYRLLWKHWQNFMGENTESAWLPETEYQIPQITSPAGGWNVGTIADHLGLPVGVDNIKVSALPFRAVAKIDEDWFRDENLTDPLVIPDGDSDQTGTNGDSYIQDVANGGMPFLVSKYHDYFTSALPAPQKGPDVPLPVASGGQLTGTAPVFGNGKTLGLGYIDNSGDFVAGGLSTKADGMFRPYSSELGSSIPGSHTGSGSYPGNDKLIGVATKEQLGDHPDYSGLYADLDGAGQANLVIGTINELRSAFQIQKFFERDSRSGSRYIEVIKSHFGVTSPDARLQRSEYLGGSSIPLNVSEIVQTSATDDVTPQGNVSGKSRTSDSRHSFKRSFTEHGVVIGLACVRYNHSYQQGIPRMFSRKDKFDFYFPEFANIGEQAILNKEIYAQGSLVLDDDTNKPFDDEVFGYQEAWADYRYKPSEVTGEMRSAYAQSLDAWHFADFYESLPYLSDEWIREDKSNVDRALAITSATSNQLFAMFYIDNMATRPMPLYSIPGLIDHH